MVFKTCYKPEKRAPTIVRDRKDNKTLEATTTTISSQRYTSAEQVMPKHAMYWAGTEIISFTHQFLSHFLSPYSLSLSFMWRKKTLNLSKGLNRRDVGERSHKAWDCFACAFATFFAP